MACINPNLPEFKELNKKAAEESLNLLDIDHTGLEPMDIKILKIIA